MQMPLLLLPVPTVYKYRRCKRSQSPITTVVPVLYPVLWFSLVLVLIRIRLSNLLLIQVRILP